MAVKEIFNTFARQSYGMGRLELVLESEHLSVYSPKYDGESLTEFEKFLSLRQSFEKSGVLRDFDSVVSAISKMLTECGARENLFRLEGGMVKAIPLFVSGRRSRAAGVLRLYCVRVSDRILIIGGGGVKKVQRYEDDAALNDIVRRLRVIERKIKSAVRKSEIDIENFEGIKGIVDNIEI